MKHKKLLYFVATLIGVLIVMFAFNDKSETVDVVSPAASPVNGMVGGTVDSVAQSNTPAEPLTAPGTTAETPPVDDVPIGAEVSGEVPPAPVVTPALPPAEGR